jgi:hemerythrin
MKIKWNESFSCFEPTIDAQHMKMVELINDMEELASLNDGLDRYDEIMAIFKELKEYTVYHFSTEESLFEKYGYDSFNVKVQKHQHQGFIEKIKAIETREIDDNQYGVLHELLDFVSQWLTNHILHTDKQFGVFIQESSKL